MSPVNVIRQRSIKLLSSLALTTLPVIGNNPKALSSRAIFAREVGTCRTSGPSSGTQRSGEQLRPNLGHTR